MEAYNHENNLVRRLEISLGFAVKTKKEQNIDKIFKQADEMMYNNKRRKLSERS
ncbi:MAG: diguanylate cyclase domain-containing protein [Halanaerobium sp.]